MVNPCYTDFKKAALEFFETDNDSKSFFETLESKAKENMFKRNMARAEAYNMSVEELMDAREYKARMHRRAAYKNLRKMNAALEQNERYTDGQKGRGMYGFFGGIESNVQGSKDSVASAMLRGTKETISYFYTLLEKAGVTEVFNKKENGELIAKAIAGEAVDNPDIMKVAEAKRKASSYSVRRANQNGAYIAEQPDRVSRQTHNIEKLTSATGSGLKDTKLRGKLYIKYKGNGKLVENEMREMAFKRWFGAILPLTDRVRTFPNVPDEEVERAFRSFWEATITGKRDVPYQTGGHPFITRTGANFADKLSAERVWFPKDAASYVEYNRQFGFGSVQNSIIAEFESMGRSIGIMDKMGTSPAAFAETYIKKIATKNRMDLETNKYVKRSKRLVKAILSPYSSPMEGLLGKIAQGTRMVMYASRLGNVLISSLPDVNNVAVALRPYGMGLLKANQIAIENFIKGMPKGELKQLALRLGVYSDGAMGSVMNKFGSVGEKGGLFARLMKLNDKVTFIDRWDNPQRFGFASVLSNHWAQRLSVSFEKLTARERTSLERYNIDSKTWELFRANKDKVDIIDRRRYLAPDIVDDFSDESIARIYYGNKSGKTTELKLRRAREDIKRIFQTYFVEETAYAKPMPDVVDRALMYGGTEPDTLAGFVWQQMTIFKSFYVTATRRVLGRFLYGNGASNLYEALVHGKADYSGLAYYVLGNIPYEYMSLSMRAIGAGKKPPSLDDPHLWKKLMQGPFYIYGSLLFDDYSRRNSFARSIVGPSISSMGDLLTLIYKTFEGKKTANAWVNTLVKNSPIVGTYGLKTVLDHTLLSSLHNAIDPTYSQRVKQRARKNGETYLWMP